MKCVDEMSETCEVRFAPFPMANDCVDGAKSRGDVESVNGCGDGGLARWM